MCSLRQRLLEQLAQPLPDLVQTFQAMGMGNVSDDHLDCDSTYDELVAERQRLLDEYVVFQREAQVCRAEMVHLVQNFDPMGSGLQSMHETATPPEAHLVDEAQVVAAVQVGTDSGTESETASSTVSETESDAEWKTESWVDGVPTKCHGVAGACSAQSHSGHVRRRQSLPHLRPSPPSPRPAGMVHFSGGILHTGHHPVSAALELDWHWVRQRALDRLRRRRGHSGQPGTCQPTVPPPGAQACSLGKGVQEDHGDSTDCDWDLDGEGLSQAGGNPEEMDPQDRRLRLLEDDVLATFEDALDIDEDLMSAKREIDRPS